MALCMLAALNPFGQVYHPFLLISRAFNNSYLMVWFNHLLRRLKILLVSEPTILLRMSFFKNFLGLNGFLQLFFENEFLLGINLGYIVCLDVF